MAKDKLGHGSEKRGVSAVEARNDRMHAMFERARQQGHYGLYSGPDKPQPTVPAHTSGVQGVGHPEPPTPVIYKKSGGEVFAAFPTLPGNMSPGTMQSYSHVGQHGSADQGYVASAKPAKPHEYADLHNELKSIGYNPQPIRKMTQAHYEARKEALK